MRNRSSLVLGIAWMFTMLACSAASEETSKLPAKSSNANTVAVNSDTQIATPQRADANVVASEPAPADQLGTAANRKDSRIAAMRKAGEGSPDVNVAEVALKNARPAPDNSTFVSYLTDAGYEIRTFKNHPQLLKVEKKIAGDGKQTIKVFLRNGKVIALPGQQLNPLATAPADYILEVAGLKSLPSTRPAAGPPPTKKPSE